MIGLYGVTLVLIAVSLFYSREKTLQGLKIGIKKFKKILPQYLKLLVLIAIVLFFAESLILSYLGQENSLLGLGAGMLLGSVTMMPGFIAYPLAGFLLERGVLYMTLAGFVTTLMMVGVLTFPVEKEYFGVKGTVLRNGVSFIIALLISVSIGLAYGELLV